MLKHRHSVLALLALGVATYGKAACLPSLFGDEWGRMYMICHGIQRGQTLNPFLRPFLPFWHTALHSLFGINVVAYHWSSLFLVVLGAVALYVALERFLPGRRPFNLIVAALFLVYPSGYPHLFFERGSYQFGLALILFGYAAMGRWLDTGAMFRRTSLSLAVLSVVLSLVLYEAHIGLAALLTVLCLFRSRRQALSRWGICCLPAAIAAVFAVGRWCSQLSVGSMFGYTADSLELSPSVLATRLAAGYDCSLIRCWTDNLQRLSPALFRSVAGMSILLVGAVATAIMIMLLVQRGRCISDAASAERIPTSPRELLMLGGFSLLAVAAGYVPMITGFAPDLSYMASRINIIPSAGAAMLIALGLAAIVRVLRLRSTHSTAVFMVLAIPLVALGCMFQRVSQELTEQGWEAQKRIYRQMAALAPNIAPDTEVLLLLPTSSALAESRICTGARPLESASWGFRAALSLLYGHRARGSFHYCTHDALCFTDAGVFRPGTATLLPYESTVVMVYDSDRQKLIFLEADGVDLPAHVRAGLALGRERIFSTPAGQAPWRFLMQ